MLLPRDHGQPPWMDILLLLTTLLTTVTTVLPSASGLNQNWCDVTCSAKRDLLCGSDNVTYVNDCFLFKAINCIGLRDLREAHRGPCSACAATRRCWSENDPVCGSDGHTYLNPCTLRATNNCRSDLAVHIRHRGACPPDPSSPFCRSHRVCRFVFMPVCGSDGRTYGNQCELDLLNDCRQKSDKVTIVKDGECARRPIHQDPCSDPAKSIKNPNCLTIHQPVCGSDGRTYENWRQLQEENDQRMDAFKVDLAYMGRCRPNPYNPNCKPTTECPAITSPVCGSDRRSYKNQCELFRKNECRLPHNWIHFLSNGVCGSTMGKSGTIFMKIVIVVVVMVVAFAIIVPLYYARRSHQLVRTWNINTPSLPLSSDDRGRYHLVATFGTDSPEMPVVPTTRV